MGLDYAASAPVLTIPPRQHNHPFDTFHYPSTNPPLPPTSNNVTSGNPPFSQAPFSGSPSSFASTKSSIISNNRVAGRKRSRADIFDSAEDDDLIDDGSYVSQPAEAPKPRNEPVYGPGMTLSYPDDPIGLHIAADSRAGSWAEERQAAIDATRSDGGRPAVVSRKSLRRFDGVGARAQSQSSLPEFTSHRDGSPHLGSTMHDSPLEDDHIDAAKLYLGVGWKSVAESSNLAIAARGWARFIENHYRLSNVTVLLHNEGKQIYLVQAARGFSAQTVFWLFAEDLRSAQMLAQTTEGVVRNLTQHPIQFEGEVITFQDRVTPPAQSSPSQQEMHDAPMGSNTVVEAPVVGTENHDIEMMIE